MTPLAVIQNATPKNTIAGELINIATIPLREPLFDIIFWAPYIIDATQQINPTTPNIPATEKAISVDNPISVRTPTTRYIPIK